MGAISERLADIARRCDDLPPLQEPVRQILIDDNRERAMAGVDVDGNPFAALKPSTIKRRGGDGPIQAPHYESSRVVTGYVVNVQAGPQRLSFIAGWPGIDWIVYHVTGTRYMPKRNPMGFRKKALDKIRALLIPHIKQR